MPHDIYDLIARRATCRAYKSDAVDEEILGRILEAGCKSPSGGGFQAISIIKVTDSDERAKLAAFSRGHCTGKSGVLHRLSPYDPGDGTGTRSVPLSGSV